MITKGAFVEIVVPDTLDLAERARLSINVLTGNLIPEKSYSVAQALIPNTPIIKSATWNIPAKNARSLPLMRVMCGSEQNVDIEYELMHTLLEQIGEDGLLRYPIDSDGAPKGYSYLQVNGLMGLTLATWYCKDNNPVWLDYLGLIGKGLQNTAIHAGERAYFPPESSIGQDGKWAFTRRGLSVPKFPYTPPAEPNMEQQGVEQCVKWEQSGEIRALVKDYVFNKNTESLKLADTVARFVLKPSLWEDTTAKGYPGYEHAEWAGHFHGNAGTLQSLLDLGVAQKSDWLKEFAREGYDEAVQRGVIRMGFVPAWTMPEVFIKNGIDMHGYSTSEGCGVADMVILAVKLTDAGLGDYWDDVESIVRNHLAEFQATDVNALKDLYKNDKTKKPEDIERFVGGFGQNALTAKGPIYGCCTANCSLSLYYAWHGITRFDGETATVNMFLNRYTPWMNVLSYLPYEGKVILQNKKAKQIVVRIPSWLDMNEITASIGKKNLHPAKSGRYLIFNQVKEKAEIEITFPVHKQVDHYMIDGTVYTISFRGNTVIDIQPRQTIPDTSPMYQRDFMKSTTTPMKSRKVFVADDIIPLI